MNKTSKEKAPLAEVPTQMVAQESQLVNFDPANQVEFAQKAAKSLMVVIDATKPLVMQGKRYLYFEHWQTIARFFNTTVGIESTTKDQNGYIAKAVVYNKDGVVIGGAEASCMNDEKNWKGKPDFQLRSMAQTRAMAKALRSMYGFVAVLAGVEATPAEEMNEVTISTQPITNSYPPTEKQIEFINSLMEQKRVDEAWVIEQGFTPLKDLTGGRTGTATELIELLKNYTPESITIMDTEALDRLDESNHKVIERLSSSAEMALADLEACSTTSEYAEVNKAISEAYTKGKFSNYDWMVIVKIAKKTVQRLTKNN